MYREGVHQLHVGEHSCRRKMVRSEPFADPLQRDSIIRGHRTLSPPSGMRLVSLLKAQAAEAYRHTNIRIAQTGGKVKAHRKKSGDKVPKTLDFRPQAKCRTAT